MYCQECVQYRTVCIVLYYGYSLLGIKYTLFHQYIDISAGYDYVYVMYWFLECYFQNSCLLYHLCCQLKQSFVRAFAVPLIVYNYDVKIENYYKNTSLFLVNSFIS